MTTSDKYTIIVRNMMHDKLAKEYVMNHYTQEQKDEYCGFLCSDVKERQQKIIQDIKDFAEYNGQVAWDVLSDIESMCSGALVDIAEINQRKTTTIPLSKRE